MPAFLPFALVVPCLSFSPVAPVSARPLLVACAAPASSSSADDAEESYQFIVGLAEKGMNEVLVREARRFLKEHGDHPKADQVRYRLATSLFDEKLFEPARAELMRLAKLRDFGYAAEVAFRLGQCELELGHTAEALAAFELVLDTANDYLKLPATFLAAEAAFRSGDFPKAEGHYQEVLAKQSEEYRADADFGLCWCAYKLHAHERAVERIQAFARAHGADERLGELRFIEGECQLEAGRDEAALAAYRQVPEGQSSDGALRGAGFACAGLGRSAESAAYFQSLLQRYPQSRFATEARLQAGIQLLQAGDARQALSVLSSGQAQNGPEWLFWRARCHSRSGEPDQALALIDRALANERALAAQPEEWKARLQVARGDALFELDRGAEAAAAYRQAGSDYALHAAAVARLNDGQAEEALRLIAPVAAKPDSAYRSEALLTQGEALFALERFEEALPSFESVARESQESGDRARSLARSGWCLFELGRHAQAAQRFGEVVATYPDSSFAAEARFMQGRASEEAGAGRAAQTAFAAYLSEHGEGPHALEAGLRLARFEPGAEAAARLEQLLRSAPDSGLAPQAHYDLAERASGDGRFPLATSHYRALLDSVPADALAAPAAYGLAWALYSQEQFAEAAATLRALLERRQLTPELRLVALELSIFCERRAGDPEAAVRAFEAFGGLCHDEPRRLRAAKVAAAALRDQGALAQAQRLFASLLEDTKQGPVAVSICVERAYLALDQGDVESAEKQVRAALPHARADAELIEAFFFVGEAWFAAGDDARAAEDYAIAAGSASEEVAAPARYKRGFSLLRSGQNEEAASSFAALVADFPKSSFAGEACFLEGEALFRAGRYERAAAPLQRVLDDFPRHEVLPKALFRLGLARAHSGNWEEAQTRLASLIQRYPDFQSRDEAELWRARALVELGNRRAARTAFRAVTERDDGVLSAQAHLGLGKLSRDEGDLDAALSAFLKVSVLYSQAEEVGEALFLAGGLLEQQNKPDRARAQYEELLERAPACAFADKARGRLAVLP